MGFRIHRGIFQKLNAERTAYENTFKIDDDGRIKEVDADGNVTSGYLKVGEQASDADTVDGIQAGSFLRSDANDETTGALRINTNWGGGYYSAEVFTIRGTYPSFTLRNTTANNKWLFHSDSSGKLQFYEGDGTDSNTWDRHFEFDKSGNFTVVGGNITTVGTVFADVFSDRNNTSYYLDPASISYLNDLRPNIIYDRNDTNYYLNLNGDSKANNFRTTGEFFAEQPAWGGFPLAPNLIHNSYMNKVTNGVPNGWSVGEGTGYAGSITIEAVSPWTHAFEGPYVAEKPANAVDDPNLATESNPYWFGRYYNGPRIARGGMRSGWHSQGDGKILKVTGSGVFSPAHCAIFPPKEENNLGAKWLFSCFVKIVKGSVFKVGTDAGYRSVSGYTAATKAQTDAGPQGWIRVAVMLGTSQITRIDALAMSMAILPDENGDIEGYIALPYLANATYKGTNYDSWSGSVLDKMERHGFYIHPSNGSVEVSSGTFTIGGNQVATQSWVNSNTLNQTEGDARYLQSVPSEYLTQTEGDARYLQSLPSHNHDSLYHKLDFDAVTSAGRPDAESGTWTKTVSTTDWGSYKVGTDADAGRAYNDAPGYVEYNIPSGYSTAYIGQLKWSSGGYFDVHAKKTDGSLVHRGRYLSKQSIENSSHGGDHDGQQIIKVSGLDGMAAIRITNLVGRVHLQGIGWTKELDTDGTQDSTTHWDLINGKPSTFAPSSHNHDSRYYTETESDARYLGISAKAADANLLDGVDSSRFVYGGNSTRTTNISNFSTALNSGFYDGYNATGNPTSSWYTLLNMRHNNTGNNYGSQIAVSFYSNADMYVRTISNGTYQGWSKIWNSANLSTTKISNWDTAYGWGNHATQGYLDAVPEEYKTQTQNDARYAAIAHNHSGVYDPAGTAQSVSDELSPRITAVETSTARNATDLATKANISGSYNQDFNADDMYVDQWFRNTVSGKGLYNQATTQHWYSDHDDYWNIAGGSSANGIRFRDEHGGTIRGYVYATNNNDVGFLDAGASWAIRHTNDWGTRFYTDGSTEEFRVGRDAVTGNYGTVETKTTRSSWGGYSINGRVVFMHDHSSGWGIYNDVNNEWMIYGRLNEYVQLRYNNSTKLQTSNTGVTVTGTVTATSFAGDGSALTGLPAQTPPINATVEGGEASTLASIHFAPGEGVATFTLADGQSFRLAFGR